MFIRVDTNLNTPPRMDRPFDESNRNKIEHWDEPNIPSFRSDRRVIRLFIARYWADRLIEKYNQKRKTDDPVGDEEVVQ